MHNNFYFLRQITRFLDSRLRDSLISECFSQSKDELILRFETASGPFLLRASLLPSLSCISFPENFQRARKNSVDLFPDIIGRRVTGIRQFNNERSFALAFADNYHLLFKMHGNRTNLVLFKQGRAALLFRNNLTADMKLVLENLDRDIDWSYEYFQKHSDQLKPAYFTFGKVVWHFLYEQDFSGKSMEQKWEAIQSLLRVLENPTYYITMLDEKPTLSLVNTGDVKKNLNHPLEAASEYYHSFTQLYAFSKERLSLLNLLGSKVAAGESYCEKNGARLAEIRNESHYRVWADIIMANLHAIPPGSDKVILENFYAGNRPEEIKLRSELSPQKNAEILYRKAKNQHIEIDRLEGAVRQKQAEINDIRQKIQQVEEADDLKAFRSLRVALDPEGRKKASGPLPFHEFYFKGYHILVGKNAQGNDALTLKHSFKEDLWLHAKDVSGSHVLIKHQAGKKFPKDVIEYAASLAAYNSKRKNESLCPVIVTPKKFVRKRKGDPPGAVVVEREEVLMVMPAKL